MSENNGCLNLLGVVAFAIGIYLWVNNVDTVVVKEQIPPPQDSWDVVYPKFRDDVSAQLLNTQRIAGSVLDATYYLESQNADLQYSVDLLLDNLGIMQKKSQEEAIRQRDEQRITNILSLFFGWFLGAFATKETLENFRKNLSERTKKNSSKPQTSNDTEIVQNNSVKISSQEYNQQDQGVQKPIISSHESSPAKLSSTDKVCPRCGKPMEIRTSPKGRKFFVCPNYQQCQQVR